MSTLIEYSPSRFLQEMPLPWVGEVRAEVVHDLLTTQQALARCNKNAHKMADRPDTRWALAASHRLPTLTVNLDRRNDRWRSFLLMAERAGLAALRVRAVDGSDSKEMSEIPESDVALHWDSTLNAKFDFGCLANLHTPFTPPERACAASHLSVWRAISAMHSAALPGIAASASHAQPELGQSASGASKMAIAQSMFRLHHLAQDENGFPIDFYLVCEDDASVAASKQAEFRETLSRLLRKLPSSVDILYLGGALPKRAAEFSSSPMGSGSFLRVNYVWMLHAYVLRGRAADTLLSHLPIHSPVDNFVASLLYHKTLTV